MLGTDLGRAVVTNAATQILLRQAPQAIDHVARVFGLSAVNAVPAAPPTAATGCCSRARPGRLPRRGRRRRTRPDHHRPPRHHQPRRPGRRPRYRARSHLLTGPAHPAAAGTVTKESGSLAGTGSGVRRSGDIQAIRSRGRPPLCRHGRAHPTPVHPRPPSNHRDGTGPHRLRLQPNRCGSPPCPATGQRGMPRDPPSDPQENPMTTAGATDRTARRPCRPARGRRAPAATPRPAQRRHARPRRGR